MTGHSCRKCAPWCGGVRRGRGEAEGLAVWGGKGKIGSGLPCCYRAQTATVSHSKMLTYKIAFTQKRSDPRLRWAWAERLGRGDGEVSMKVKDSEGPRAKKVGWC